MLDKVVVFTKKRALSIIFICALVLFLMILTKWLVAYKNNETGLSTFEGRKSFLSELGWEIKDDSEVFQSIQLPEALDGVMEDYNDMQIEQSFLVFGPLLF